MEVRVTKYISLVNDNPIHAVLVGRNTKAYLVANLAFLDGTEASAEHYGISLAAVYATMSFYEENRETIEQALEEAHQGLLELGMKDGKKEIARLKKRMAEIKSKQGMKQGDTTNP